jgi:uncharacterized protein (TIGR00299 family) protein
MAVGALLDLGFPIEEIAARVKALGIKGLEVSAEKVTRAGIAGTKYVVRAPEEHEHRGLAEVGAILAKASLPITADALARDVFARLARAESKIHSVPIDQVHFHEVGAADAIADVVGFALAWTGLGISSAFVSPLPWTKGRAEAAHGSIPIPAPATVALLEGFAFETSPVEGELITPTGAAIVAAVAKPGSPPPFTLKRAGFGAGTKDFAGRANLTRVVLAEPAAAVLDTAAILEANLDDMTPELVGALVERLRAAGALDVWTTAAQMKKHRPGVVLSVLAAESEIEALSSLVFRESTTIGLRITRVERRVLDREIKTVDTEFGPIRVKIARLAGDVVNAAPEFEDVRAAAEKAGVPVKTVMAAANRSIG